MSLQLKARICKTGNVNTIRKCQECGNKDTKRESYCDTQDDMKRNVRLQDQTTICTTCVQQIWRCSGKRVVNGSDGLYNEGVTEG